MPAEPASSVAVGTRSVAARLLRFTGYALAAAAALSCLALLALRFVLMPRVEVYRADIAAFLTRALGQPVEIDAIGTDWDGWNPQFTVRGLRILDRSRAAAQPVVELPEVRGSVAWTSLLVADLRLRELTIDRPRLAVRRDVAGRVHVAGLEIDPGADASDAPLMDWLLRQHLIVVRDALIAWNDDRRNAPQLLLDQVQFRLESRFGRHRFGLRGTPPSELAAPIDVRGELSAAAFADWPHAHGRLYVRLDYADMAAWSEWLPLPLPVQSGKGALRVWFGFAEGVARELVADLELVEVRTRLAPDLPPLDLAHLAGRLTWKQEGARRELAARELSFTTADGTRLIPTDFALRYDVAPDGRTEDGRAQFERIELGPLAKLAANLPLPEAWRRDLLRLAPRGILTDAEHDWVGPLAEPASFRTRGAFIDLGINAGGDLPGVTGVSGQFDATQAGGSLRLGSRNLALTFPRVFAEPIALETATGRVRWERAGGALAVAVEELEFANADAAGTARGSWKSRPQGPGEVDVEARIARGSAAAALRYVPLTLSKEVRDWLRTSLPRGTAEDARLVLKGDLARFPFVDGRSGQFLVTFRTVGVTVDYVDGWPPVEDLDADVRFEGERVQVTARRGRILGAALARTTAEIPDLLSEYPRLRLTGEAAGQTAEFLRFVETSPVGGWIGHATDGASATGQGRLGLRLEMLVGKPDATAKVAGDYQFSDNQLRLPGVPTLAKVNGRLAFTERDVTARDLTLEALGGPARLAVGQAEGGVRVTGSGTANLATLRGEFGAPLADRLTGTADWRISVDARPEFARWVLESSLKGATVTLPPPAGKTAQEAVALRIERRSLPREPQLEALTIDYGDVGRVVAHRRLASSGHELERALVLLGAAARAGGEPERAGVTVRGDVATIDLDAWVDLAGGAGGGSRANARPATARGSASPDLVALDLEARELVALGRKLTDVKLSVRPAADGYRISVAAPAAEGRASWESASARRANGRVSAQFARLDLGAATEVHRAAPASAPPGSSPATTTANQWPELDITAEKFHVRKHDAGRMELKAQPAGPDWRIEKFVLANDAGRIEADGTWRGGREPQTKLDVAADIRDAGAFLPRLGLPAEVKAAPTQIQGQVAWAGSPTDFDYPSLAGTLRINVGAGQFTRIDPGVGRLLGVLSLQALPRRITLDFRDVFSEGFAFDTISGTARISGGVMRTDNLLLSGPAARVNIAGDIDLARETQQLSVRVQPALATTVSAGAGAAAAVLMAANPLVGAAIGAGTLLAQKIMKDPIEQMFSYTYAVRGSWSEPVVERVATPPLAGASPGATGSETAASAPAARP